MSDSNNTTRGVGSIGFLGLLTIVLIALKLTGHIVWSWWYVFAPLWVPWLVVIGLGVIYICVMVFRR